ncbi:MULTISPECIES: TetR/AcrR family transcriptional regulator [unclassified Pseudonocardia]|uniref:TetR/AcrR family transcriptional regulator n=1 Tax=unclassified Pseudonocardia TaxID=2619320 RepID=UPI000B31AAB9|nr:MULTISPECIES: TetR/AcrR family transcriptional regulator [unclassified Pseudonocardia]
MTGEQGTARRGRPPMSEQGRRAQRLAVSRAAVRLFREHGMAATSGADVARAAGVSERTLWRLFRTKESLVEPLLSVSIEGFRDVLRSWPEGTELTAHLRGAYTFATGGPDGETEEVLAVVRMTRDTPALRAVWLVLQEQAEPTLAAVLAPRAGLAPDSAQVRLLAATVNAAFRVVTDEVAAGAAEGATAEALAAHRELLAEALRTGGQPAGRQTSSPSSSCR